MKMDPIIIKSQQRTVTANLEARTIIDTDPVIIPTSKHISGVGSSASSGKPIVIPKYQKPSNAKGRPARHKEFPTLVKSAKDFIEAHGFSAQSRRRSDVATSSGVTLKQVQDHLLDNVEGLKLKGININTVHRLMVPPNKKHRSSKLFKSLIQARVPGKSNKLIAHQHSDFHFTAAQVNYICEMFTYFDDETLLYSGDDKNKINVGTLAVSRYHQISAFFPAEDKPDYADHDFPYRNSKITPSGYIRLERKESIVKNTLRARSKSPQKEENGGKERKRSNSASRLRQESLLDESLEKFKRDKHGRLHLSYPRTGTLQSICNASIRFFGEEI